MALVLVADPSLPICAALKKFLESARHQVTAVHSVAEAVETAREKDPDLLFVSTSGSFDGEALCERVRSLQLRCSVVLVFAPEEDRPEERAETVDADAFLVGPLKRAQVVGVAALVLKVASLKAQPKELERLKALEQKYKAREAELQRSLEPAKAREPRLLEAVARLNGEIAELKSREQPSKQRIRALEDEAIALSAEIGKLKDHLKAAGDVVPGGEVAFLKRFLPLEVKRSKRYQYPVAVVLIGIDKLDERMETSASPEFQRAAIRAEAMQGIHKVVRDIDLAVPFSDDKYLVRLPHTPRDGAITVASRIQAELSGMDAFEGGTASVGVSCYEPRYWTKAHVSFGGLMREATTALLRAQTAGGDTVEAAPLPGKPKRDRISIG